MSQIAQKFQLNLEMIKRCREQVGLSQAEVETKIDSISSIESGKKRPTYKQLDTLADLYQVPRWVFITDELLQEYQYMEKPAFRKFKDVEIFQDAKIRKLIARVEQYRDLLIDNEKILKNLLYKIWFFRYCKYDVHVTNL